MSGRLVVCPTPIGNLEDVTLRVLAALREADVVACEDTRRTRVLLDRYGVKASLVSYHEHNERSRAGELVGRMREGAVVALVSDAGMPVISDPGFELVRASVAAGLPVEVLPGPSAALAAVVASGLPADAWHFVGFLPRKRAELERLFAATAETLVAFESPRRVAASLAVLASLDPARPVAVARELTKVHEEAIRGTLASFAALKEQEWLGEVTLVLGPQAVRDAPSLGEEEIDARIDEGLSQGRRAKDVAEALALETGRPKRELYARVIARRGHARLRRSE